MRRFSHAVGPPLWLALVLAAAMPANSVTTEAAAGRAERPTQERGDAVEKITVWDGAYSEAQAQRGNAVYQHLCTACHHGELQGDRDIGAPALAGEAFFTNWNALTVEALFDKIFRTMPYEEPETLNPLDTVDLVAYILQFNKFPSGEVELVAEAGRLGGIVIERTDPRSGE